MDEDRRQLLALCRVKGAKWELLAREAQRPGGIERLVLGQITESSASSLDTADALLNARSTESERLAEIDEECSRAFDAGARLVTVLDDDYPTNLRLVYNLPPFLFVLGELLGEDERAVAVVGTRNASPAGLELAAAMSQGLTAENVTVVSGLARGIDTSAHQAALDAGGRTIAVMGTGILNRYPKENIDLAAEIQSSGALVSQFWPSAPPAQYNFPRRNVVTSGISQGTVVVEATSTSGAKMQARLAAEHGKLVFLVRSLVTDEKWAQTYLRSKPRVFEVETVDDVTKHLESNSRLAALRDQRSQLAFDLA